MDTAPALSFAQRYAASENPYLRAAAMELTDTRTAAPQASVPPPSAAMCAPVHVPPTLTRPASTFTAPSSAAPHRTAAQASTRLDNVAERGSSAVAATRNPFDPAPAPIRGIPVFTSATAHTRRADAAPPFSPAPSRTPAAASLRQSMQDYGQARLQEEAVRWYYRCSAAEQQVAQLQAALERQAKLLAAAHWPSGGTSAQQPTANGKAGEAEEDTEGLSYSPSPSPDRPRGRHATAATSRVAALTSRSPDSVSRAYAVTLGEETCCASGDDEPEREDGDASSRHDGTRHGQEHRSSAAAHACGGGPVLAALSVGEMPCRVPRSCVADDHAASKSLASLQAQHVSRSLVETTATTAAPSDSLSVARVSVGQQTDAASSLGAPLLDRDTEQDTLRAESLTPAPSAIMSKQYVAAIAEVEELRVRVDVAERESADLRRECAAQELRCDELETQLLSKAEQLLRQEERQQQPQPQHEGAAASPAATTVDLGAAVAQVRDALAFLSRREGRTSAEKDETSIEVGGDMAKVDADVELSPALQLTVLVTQLRDTAASLCERHAALQAELDVVRADRNELIGEQSEQVRQLQQQLLEKDTAQWRLLEELQHTRAQLDVTSGSRANTAGPSPAPVDTAPSPTHRATPATSADADAKTVMETVPATAFTALQAELREARAAAAAQLEAQRCVLTERLTSAEKQLQEAQLRAEDEYDRLSGTIEGLTRELSEARAALRVKEASLRIALRASFSPPLLLPAFDAGAPPVVAAPTAQLDVVASPPPSPSGCSPKLLIHERQSASPSPSVPPPPPPRHRWEALVDRHGDDVAADDDGGRAARADSGRAEEEGEAECMRARPDAFGSASKHKKAPLTSLPFNDDGTLRTLPSSVHVEESEHLNTAAEGEESEGRAEAGSRARGSPHRPYDAGQGDGLEQRRWRTGLAFGGHANPTASTSLSSREKSSRGLTVSMGDMSHVASSQPRGRSDGSAAVAVEGPASTSPARTRPSLSPETSAVLEAQTEQVTASRRTAQRDAAVLAALSVPAAPTSASADLLRQARVEGLGAARERPPRRSASARLAGASADEELPLPLPQRSPLFGLASTAGGSPSPNLPALQPQHTPSPPPARRGSEHGARLGITPEERLRASAHPYPSRLSASPSSPGPAMRSVARGGVANMPPPQTPEEKLRDFLDSLSAEYDDSDVGSNDGGWGARSRLAAETDARQLDATAAASKAGAGSRSSRPAAAPTAAAASSDGSTTPGRTPLSIFSASATPVSTQATPAAASPGSGGSPRSAEAAARYTQASMRRYRELWQQHESLLQSLLSSPS